MHKVLFPIYVSYFNSFKIIQVDLASIKWIRYILTQVLKENYILRLEIRMHISKQFLWSKKFMHRFYWTTDWKNGIIWRKIARNSHEYSFAVNISQYSLSPFNTNLFIFHMNYTSNDLLMWFLWCHACENTRTR